MTSLDNECVNLFEYNEKAIIKGITVHVHFKIDFL